MSETSSTACELTDAERARMERNREKALELRKNRLVAHPYKKKDTADNIQDSIIKVQGKKYIDSGGGFLIENDLFTNAAGAENSGNEQKQLSTAKNNKNNKKGAKSISDAAAANDQAINVPVTCEECIECGDQFADSYLWNNFSHAVCDKCRDAEEKHSLITRTEAKAEYLLKDCDFDKREPPLRFISRKNPHNVRWGEMKLYLHLQVEKRAMEVWGSEEELLRQHENRDEKREVSKVRRYNKQMKQLRMEVRSSLYTKETSAVHVHEYGPDTYNEDDDNYTHQCLKCHFIETYEKM